MRIGIVGGGLMGLALAQKLSKNGNQVTLFEKERQLGGLATYADFGTFFWDKFYHVILPTDSSLLQLLSDFGLSSKIEWRNSSAGYFTAGKFHAFSSFKDFLTFPGLNLWQKFRLGWTIFYGSRIKNWEAMEVISVRDWLIRVGGKATFDRFWEPLLLAKLGKDYHQVSAVFIWTYIKRLFEARKSPAHKEQMGYVRGGYKTVIETVAELLRLQDTRIYTDTEITDMKPNSSTGISLSYAIGKSESFETEVFDKVIFTAPVNVLRKVADPRLLIESNGKPNSTLKVNPGINELKPAQEKVQYLGVICLVVVSEVPLSPFYVLNIADDKLPFTGVIGMSALVDKKETGGKYLTYFPKYLKHDHPFWELTTSELEAKFMKGAMEMFPQLNEHNLVSAHVHHAKVVQPLQVLNYSKIAPHIRTEHPDLYLLNTTQFTRDTLNNNSVARHVAEFMEVIGSQWKPCHKEELAITAD